MMKSLKHVLTLALFSFCTFAASALAEITYFYNDLNGSPLVATNEAGVVIWRESYRPYGERLKNETGSQENKTWFTSRHQDEDTGLVYMGARFYDPMLARFVSVDPQRFSEKNIHSFNRYAYGNNNPVRYYDRNGMWAEDAILAVPGLMLGAHSLGQNLQQGNWGSALVDFGGMVADGVALALPGVPGVAGLSIAAGRAGAGQALKLEKALASEAQTAKILAGDGDIIAGAGSRKVLDQASRLEKEVGGKAGDWSKVSGGSHVAKDGTKIETHAFENKVTNQTTQIKTKLKDEGQ